MDKQYNTYMPIFVLKALLVTLLVSVLTSPFLKGYSSNLVLHFHKVGGLARDSTQYRRSRTPLTISLVPFMDQASKTLEPTFLLIQLSMVLH